MTALFADASFFVAYLNRRDLHHHEATTYLQDSAARFITTQWVLCELANYFASSPLLRGDVAAFIRALRADVRFTIVSATSAAFDEGLVLYEARSDKEWSLTDCIFMVTIQRRKLTRVLTADHHFAQAGLDALLRRDSQT